MLFRSFQSTSSSYWQWRGSRQATCCLPVELCLLPLEQLGMGWRPHPSHTPVAPPVLLLPLSGSVSVSFPGEPNPNRASHRRPPSLRRPPCPADLPNGSPDLPSSSSLAESRPNGLQDRRRPFPSSSGRPPPSPNSPPPPFPASSRAHHRVPRELLSLPMSFFLCSASDSCAPACELSAAVSGDRQIGRAHV